MKPFMFSCYSHDFAFGLVKSKLYPAIELRPALKELLYKEEKGPKNGPLHVRCLMSPSSTQGADLQQELSALDHVGMLQSK